IRFGLFLTPRRPHLPRLLRLGVFSRSVLGLTLHQFAPASDIHEELFLPSPDGTEPTIGDHGSAKSLADPGPPAKFGYWEAEVILSNAVWCHSSPPNNIMITVNNGVVTEPNQQS